MHNNIHHISILSKYKKYRHLSVMSKILTLAGVLLIICFVWMKFRTPIHESDQEVDIGSVEDKLNYEMKILNSTFSGINNSLYPYQVNTSKMVKTFDNNYLLDKIVAKYKINKDEELVVNAKNAILNEETQILKLKNNVELLFGQSILKTQEAQLDLLNKEAFSDCEIVLFFKNSKLKANNFSSTNNNMLINFEGKVTTVIDMSDF